MIGLPRCIDIKIICVGDKLSEEYVQMLMQSNKQQRATSLYTTKKPNKKSSDIKYTNCLTIEELPESRKFDSVFIRIKNKKEISIINHLISLHKNIFIENPNMIIGEWNKLKYASEEAGIILDYSFINCIDYMAIQIRNHLDSKKYGKLLMLQSHNMCKNLYNDYECIYDALIQDVISTTWLFKEMPEMINAIINKIQHKYNDFVSITLEFKNNKIAIISSDLIMQFHEKNFSAIGENGTITNHSIMMMENQYIDQYIRNERLVEIQKFLLSVEQNDLQSIKLNKIVDMENIINAIIISSKKYIPIYLNT